VAEGSLAFPPAVISCVLPLNAAVTEGITCGLAAAVGVLATSKAAFLKAIKVTPVSADALFCLKT